MKIQISKLAIFFLALLSLLSSCNDSKEIGEIKDHRFDPKITVVGGSTGGTLTTLAIGEPLTLDVALNNATSGTFTLLPELSGNATLLNNEVVLSSNTPTNIDVAAHGNIRLKLTPTTAGVVNLKLTLQNEKFSHTIAHNFEVVKSPIDFKIDKKNIEGYTNNLATFTLTITPPTQGMTYTLTVEKQEGKGTLSNTTQKDIAHNDKIEIPSSYVIPFSYLSNETGKHILRFTVTDNTGDKHSENVEINLIQSDYNFKIATPQTILKLNTTYPIIIKANKEGYSKAEFSVKYTLKEGKGEFKQSDRTISEGSTFNILKGIETAFTFTPTVVGNYTITFITTIDDKNYENTLSFQIKNYTLSITPNNPTWGSVTGGGNYIYDTEVPISATPSEHYNFVGFYEGEKELTNMSQYLLKIDRDYNLTARFIPIGYNIIVLSSQGGKATKNKEIYTIGEDAVLTATAETNYQFSHWNQEGKEVSKSNPFTIQVTKNDTYEAIFIPKKHKVEVQSTGNGQATILNNGTGYVDHKGSATLKAIPVVGYHSIGWWEGDKQISPLAEYTVTDILTDKMFTAKFEINSYNFNSSATVGGSVNPTENSTSYTHGTAKILTATAEISHTFSHWELNGQEYSKEPTISVTLTDNADYKAIFKIKRFSITLESDGSTRSTPSANPSVVDYGSSTTLTPNTHADDYFLGYKVKGSPTFIHGNVVSNITSDTHIIAHYRNNTITVTHKRESPYSVYLTFSENIPNNIEVTLSFENQDGNGYITETTIIPQGTKSIPVRINDKDANNANRYELTIRKISSTDTYNYHIER